jgi:hypothetical protein
MNEQTFTRKLEQLVTLIDIHPNREELLQLMEEQVTDDTELVV